MTGRCSVRSVLGTVILGGSHTLQDWEFTLAEVFKSGGYSTAMVGKWHLGFAEQSWPTRQGFEEFHVGVNETSGNILYREQMERAGLSEAEIEASFPGIYESDSEGNLVRVREYTLEYRRQIDGDMAKASVDYIKRQAQKSEPFFLYIAWNQPHYPNLTALSTSC